MSNDKESVRDQLMKDKSVGKTASKIASGDTEGPFTADQVTGKVICKDCAATF